VRAVYLFSERLVNVWDSLPDSTDFSRLHFLGLGALFCESVFLNFLKVFSVIMLICVLCVFTFVCHC